MVQVTPYQGANPLRAIALGEQVKQGNARLEQNERRIQLSEQQIEMAAKQAGLERDQFVQKLFLEAVEKTGSPMAAAQWMEGVTGQPMPDDMRSRFESMPAESFGGGPKAESFSGGVKQGLDANGNPVYFQAGDQGTVRTLDGVTPPPKSGEQISVGPDGKVTITRGPGAGLSNSTAASMEKEVIADSELLSMTRNVLSTYKPQYQTVGAKFDAAVLSGKAKLDPESISQSERQYLAEFSDYKSNAANLQSKVINQLAGAAVSESEAARINGFLINPGTGIFDGDDPITAEAKLKRYERNVSWAIARKQWFLRNGIEANESNWNKHSLENMPSIIKQRHQEIVSELSAQNPDMTAKEIQENAIQIGKREFGLL